MKRVWTDSSIIKHISHLLPSPKTILNNQLNSNSNHDLIESIEIFNELAAYYAQIAVRDLDLNQQHHRLLNASRSLASTLYPKQVVIWHSTQLRLIQLIERFPRLKPFLILLNKYDSHLKDILSGEKNGLDRFVGDDEIEQIFQQIKTLISATKTRQIFHSICQHLQLQYEQTKDNLFENYRLRIFWLTDNDCLLIDLHYADSDPIQLANAQQTFNTHITNQTNLSIIYDETIALYDSKTLEKIPTESFHIIFSSNHLLENQDLTNSLINLRRLLVHNVLLLLLELVHVPLYFDLIFGFIDQCQKTISNDILQRLDERKNQLWLKFSKDDNNNKKFKQNEELICGTLSLILQIIKKSSPHFHPLVYVLTNNAQFNNDSNLNIIPSPFIGRARGLITEYERNRLKLIDLQTSLNSNNNQSTFIHTLIEYMINSRYSNDICQVVLRLNHTNQNQVQHLTCHYEMLQNNDDDKEEKSKYEQISIIPKRDADQKSCCICVPPSRFLSQLTWIEEDREKELLPPDMVD
ncbi:unnamed protein product [Adineta steineri]|uniref:Uncharacterized protein n=1 Tax=Adineta steineri TaxID=433720 RepID=A0A814RVR2_9BILA|nr:unnamed protein product [Adineta steineri]CAF1147705.1 unnamed protein product [Adineta steineri]